MLNPIQELWSTFSIQDVTKETMKNRPEQELWLSKIMSIGSGCLCQVKVYQMSVLTKTATKYVMLHSVQPARPSFGLTIILVSARERTNIIPQYGKLLKVRTQNLSHIHTRGSVPMPEKNKKLFRVLVCVDKLLAYLNTNNTAKDYYKIIFNEST